MTNKYNRKLPLSSIISKTVFAASAISAGICSTNAVADNFTVTSSSSFTNTTKDKSLTYKDNFFRPGNHSEYEGSAGFFDAQGATEAVNIVTGVNAGNVYNNAKVQLGGEDDTTNLKNMLTSIDVIDQTNKLRKQNNLSELKITDKAMAVAQVSTDWARYKTAHSGFAGQNGFAENLSWSFSVRGAVGEIGDENIPNSDLTQLATINGIPTYIPAEGSGSWYGEKVCVDSPTSQACNKRYGGETGHYRNLLASNQIAGAAVGTSYTGYGTQTYGGVYGGAGDATTYTVEEYKALLEAYIENDGWSFYNSDNTVDISNNLGADSKVAGGYANSGLNATGNTVNIQSNANAGTVYGGYAFANNTDGNTVNLAGGTVGTIYGGYAENNAGSHKNTINIKSGSADAIYLGNAATVSGTVNYLGGTVGELKALQGNGTVRDAVMNFGAEGKDENLSRTPMNTLKVGKLGGFNQYNFYLPSNIKNGDTAVQVTGDEAVNLSGASVNAYIHSDTNMNAGDAVHLLATNAGVTDDYASATVYKGLTQTDEAAIALAGNNLDLTWKTAAEQGGDNPPEDEKPEDKPPVVTPVKPQTPTLTASNGKFTGTTSPLAT
ncbi:MAG: hypothetical protein IJ566_02905, partial [Cardiobacteriaceae bacterium]|nr:hypothetical protein [Cardiobacteriaceae bacterium]